MVRQFLVEVGVVGIQHIDHRSIAAKELLEEPDRFLIHIGTPPGEGREQSLVLALVLVEFPEPQPLGGKLHGQGTGAAIPEHPPGLPDQYLRVPDGAGGGQSKQLVVGHGGPEEIAEAAGQLPTGNRSRFHPCRRLLDAVEKVGRHQHPSQQAAQRRIMLLPPRPQRTVQVQQIHFLPDFQRPAIGALGKPKQGIQVPGFRGAQRFPELLGPAADRFLPRFAAELPVVGPEIPPLVEGIVDGEGVLTDVA